MVTCFLQYPAELPCSSKQSELTSLLCSTHFTAIFNIDVAPITLPIHVANYTKFDTLGLKLYAVNLEKKSADDVVFNCGDTIIPFGEYVTEAFVADQTSLGSSWQECDNFTTNEEEINVMNDELMCQRNFSRVITAIRFLAKSIPNMDNEQLQELFREKLAEIIVKAHAIYDDELQKSSSNIKPDVNFQAVYLTSDKPIYVVNKFRLSKPLHSFYRKILTEGATYKESMPWQFHVKNLPSSTHKEYEDYVTRMHLVLKFRKILCSMFISLPFQFKPNQFQNVMTREDLFHVNVERISRLDYAGGSSKSAHFLFQPLMNQYDDSYSGRCHNYMLPLPSNQLSNRVLDIISMLVLPIEIGTLSSTATGMKLDSQIDASELREKMKFFEVQKQKYQTKTVSQLPPQEEKLVLEEVQ